MLSIHQGHIIDDQNQPIQLRGVCIGGWMNMESFINGFPGTEQGQRTMLAEVIGPKKARFFFDCWLDYILAEEDIAFIQSLGVNAVRLPLNYRHFESDLDPFHYLESGFTRLDRVLTWCAKYGLYAILDLHAIQGWQNPDWHSDNPTHTALFWKQRTFQDRFIALWQEIARRYVGNTAVAGYDLMNEPLSDELSNQVYGVYRSNWPVFNAIYRRAVDAIRAIDRDHLIFLEGDGFASKFTGLAVPFDPNLVYSSHNYNRPGWGPGAYPGQHREGWWDLNMVEKTFLEHEGTQFTQLHGVPLYIGEFGSVFNGKPEDRSDRLRGMDDNIAIFERYHAHWTVWTYKDLGVMGWVYVNPESPFQQHLMGLQSARQGLHTDTWMYWLPKTPADQLLGELAQEIQLQTGDLGIDLANLQGRLAKVVLAGSAGHLLQYRFAQSFAGMAEEQIDDVLKSFALANCRSNEDLLDVVRKHLAPEAVSLAQPPGD